MTTIDLAIQIIELALSLVKGSQNASIAAVLVQIVGKAMQAYQAHVGQPMDTSLIKVEAPV